MKRVFIVAHPQSLRTALAQTIADQAPDSLCVVGQASWQIDILAAIVVERPDIVILVMGFEAAPQLRMVTALRQLAPRCRVLVIDSLDMASGGARGEWGGSVVVLCAEQLATDLVPAIERLGKLTEAASPVDGGTHPDPPAGLVLCTKQGTYVGEETEGDDDSQRHACNAALCD